MLKCTTEVTDNLYLLCYVLATYISQAALDVVKKQTISKGSFILS